jgi:hypothetical protein
MPFCRFIHAANIRPAGFISSTPGDNSACLITPHKLLKPFTVTEQPHDVNKKAATNLVAAWLNFLFTYL